MSFRSQTEERRKEQDDVCQEVRHKRKFTFRLVQRKDEFCKSSKGNVISILSLNKKVRRFGTHQTRDGGRRGRFDWKRTNELSRLEQGRDPVKENNKGVTSYQSKYKRIDYEGTVSSQSNFQ